MKLSAKRLFTLVFVMRLAVRDLAGVDDPGAAAVGDVNLLDFNLPVQDDEPVRPALARARDGQLLDSERRARGGGIMHKGIRGQHIAHRRVLPQHRAGAAVPGIRAVRQQGYAPGEKAGPTDFNDRAGTAGINGVLQPAGIGRGIGTGDVIPVGLRGDSCLPPCCSRPPAVGWPSGAPRPGVALTRDSPSLTPMVRSEDAGGQRQAGSGQPAGTRGPAPRKSLRAIRGRPSRRQVANEIHG